MGRIMIVDDVESDRCLVEAILERAGHETFQAVDGRGVVDRCAELSIDVVVTDLQMPEVHGFELITSLREDPDSPPIIAVSGTGPYQLEIADALGAKFTLSKPVDPHALLTAVEQVLRFRSSSDRAKATKSTLPG